MRKAAAVLLAVVLILPVVSCKKIIKQIFPGFETTIPEFSFTLPTLVPVTPSEVEIGTITQQFNLDDTIRSRTAGVFNQNDVGSIKITQIVMTLDNADELNNQANFQSVRFTLTSNTKTEPVELASVTFPDTYGTSYTYTSTNPPELKDYLKGTTLEYHIFGQMRRPLTKALKVRVLATVAIR